MVTGFEDWQGPLQLNILYMARTKDAVFEQATQIGNGTTTVYTVPAGKVAFITSLVLVSYGTGDHRALAGGVLRLRLVANATSETADLKAPLKLTAGQTIQVNVSLNGTAQVIATGWEEDA